MQSLHARVDLEDVTPHFPRISKLDVIPRIFTEVMLVYLFNDMSTFVVYSMLKPSLKKKSKDTIHTIV